MSFTKRDYEAVARIIRTEHEHARKNSVGDYGKGRDHAAFSISRDLSAYFAENNPRFDADRFAKACEPGGGK